MNGQQRLQRQLEEVLKMPGNDRCADCRAPAPRWASVNLGIFLCVACASVHRKMGTHRSRVKSCTLDEWTREQIMTMKNMGNTKSNAIYNPDPVRHPPPAAVAADERDADIHKFIRRKYELGAFKAGASRDLADASVNSRTQALQARGVMPTRRSPIPDTNRDLPALPSDASPPKPTSARPARSSSNAPVWKTNTGSSTSSSANSLAPPVTPAALPPRGASHNSPGISTMAKPEAKSDLLVDIGGSSSSTRPLQLLGGFPTVPAAPAVAPLASPGILPAPSPLALGQQAFNWQISPSTASNNPFGGMQQAAMAQQGYGHTLSPGGMQPFGGMHAQMTGMNGGMSSPMGMNHTGMGMGGGMQQAMMSPGGGMGMGMNGMSMNGVSMNGMNGMNGMNMGMGVAQPVQYGGQQQYQWSM